MKQAIILGVGFKKSLVFFEKELSGEIGVRDTTEATRRELETQLKESKVKLSTAKKI